MFDWAGASRQDKNLVCLGPDGHIRWVAELPTTDPNDCFTAVGRDGGLLLANTWSCFAVWIDPDTGRTVRSEFTK